MLSSERRNLLVWDQFAVWDMGDCHFQHRSVDRTGNRPNQLGFSPKGKPFAQARSLAWHHQPLSSRNGWMLPDRHCLKHEGKAAPWVSRCRLCGAS